MSVTKVFAQPSFQLAPSERSRYSSILFINRAPSTADQTPHPRPLNNFNVRHPLFPSTLQFRRFRSKSIDDTTGTNLREPSTEGTSGAPSGPTALSPRSAEAPKSLPELSTHPAVDKEVHGVREENAVVDE